MNYNNIFVVYWNTMLDMYIDSLNAIRNSWHDSNRT